MSAPRYFDGEPRSGIFWWLAKLASGGDGRAATADRQLFAARRGSGLETFVLSALVGLAALGVAFELSQRWAGVWAWGLALPVGIVGLHLLGFCWAAAGELLIRARLMPGGCRAGFNGLALAGSIAVAGVLLGAWLALPWIAFVVGEAFAYPARRFWEMSGKEQG